MSCKAQADADTQQPQEYNISVFCKKQEGTDGFYTKAEKVS
jgi:hypothetical protein